IELGSQNSTFLCVTYNAFPIDNVSLQDVSLDYHLTNLIRLVLIGVITECGVKGIANLNNDQRHFIYLFANRYLSQIERSDLKASIEAIKSLPDKARDWWNKFTGPVGLAVNAVLNKMGIGAAEIKKFAHTRGILGSATEQLRLLRQMAAKLG